MHTRRGPMSTRAATGPIGAIGASLAIGLALVAGVTLGALSATATAAPAPTAAPAAPPAPTAAPAAAVPHVQRTSGDLLAAPSFRALDTVHATFTVTDFGDDNADPANCTTPSASCTLRGAVAAANADTGNVDDILIPSGNTVTLSNGVIDLDNSMLINGPGATVNGGGKQIFDEDTESAAVQITGLTLTDGVAAGSGGAFEQNAGSLLLDGVTLSGNSATVSGGAIFSDGELWVDNCTFTGNTVTDDEASEGGGGLFIDEAAYVENSTFTGNTAPYGAGLDNWDGALTLVGSDLSGNSSGTDTFGDGVGMYTDELTMGSSDTFDNNVATDGGNGTGVENEYQLDLSNSHIDNNSTTGGDYVEGGGLYDSGEADSFTNVTVNGTTNNVTDQEIVGGAVYADSLATFSGLTVTNTANSGADIYGGALINYYQATVTNAQISSTSNHATTTSGGEVYGGAIYNEYDLSVNNVTVTGTTDTADLATAPTPSTTPTYVYGGALLNYDYVTASSLSITDTTATASGGDGQVYGGIDYTDDHENLTDVDMTGATVTADDYIEGGLLVNYYQVNATNWTLGSATVNVPGSTAKPSPQADGSVVYTDGALNVVNGTIDDTTTSVASGGDFNWGIEVATDTGEQLTNTTIANDALTGPSGNTFLLYVDHDDSISLLNTIVSSTTPPLNCGFASGGVIASEGHNLDSGTSCNMTAPGDLQNANPQVQPLANNGGQVLTGALAPTSPAIDAGSNAGCPSTDARGVPRPQGSACDIGSFEYVLQGYWMDASDGGIFSFGNAKFYGSMGGIPLNQPVVGMARTADSRGYWLVASDGGIFSFGDATFYGSTGNIHLNQPVVGMAATPDGGGYWLVASDGGIFSFGDATFYGSTGNIHLNQPVVGMAATPDGGGYWLVASDGGIFSFGDATFYGSTGNIHLNQPVVGMAATPDGGGYWLVASDGGIFSFGDAKFYGSTGNIHLNQPVVGMATTPTGNGYFLFASDGGVFNYGDAIFQGSMGGTPLNKPVVGGAGTGVMP